MCHQKSPALKPEAAAHPPARAGVAGCRRLPASSTAGAAALPASLRTHPSRHSSTNCTLSTVRPHCFAPHQSTNIQQITQRKRDTCCRPFHLAQNQLALHSSMCMQRMHPSHLSIRTLRPPLAAFASLQQFSSKVSFSAAAIGAQRPLVPSRSVRCSKLPLIAPAFNLGIIRPPEAEIDGQQSGKASAGLQAAAAAPHAHDSAMGVQQFTARPAPAIWAIPCAGHSGRPGTSS